MATSDTALCRQWEAEAEEAEEAEDSDMRYLKLARTEPRMIAPGKAAPFFIPGSNSIFPDAGQMLSFSSTSKKEALMSTVDGTLPYYHYLSGSALTPSPLRNTGLNSETLGKNMHRVLGRVRGPFTPSQWLELERQAMIYKYMDANVAIPPSLLIRGFGSCAFPPSSTGYFGSSSLGWGQGVSGREDPEPGRCRRTDGKKWRCSRDAVADQKYCERHMNRGRHRSRKHVEGHSGHAAEVMPAIVPSQPASTVSAAGFSINVTKSLPQTQNFQTTYHFPEQMDRTKTRGGNAEEGKKESEDQCMLGSLNATPSSDLLQAPKEQNPFEEPSLGVQLGLVSMNFPMRPPSCSLLQQIEPCHLQNFADEFYKNQFACSNTPGSGIEEVHSVTMSCSSFVSSTLTCDDLRSFPFKSSKEFDTVDLGLSSEVSQHHSGWVPGPLGEVLNSTSATTNAQCNNLLSSSMHLLTEGCDLNKWVEVSPNAVLQKAPFQSVPSSTVSSPRTEENHNGSICNDILSSANL